MPYPRIPTTITVHLGTPSSNARNVRVPFIDYIKNVASSEIYPTWPTASLRANILAIQSFAMNRVFTEYYRTRGYDFDITNSTAYDQSFIPGREFFDSINRIVDEIFNSYIVRGNQIQPLAAQYCSGTSVTCNGLSQWGTVSLANQGYSDIQILRYYYGRDVSIVYDAPVAANIQSYPGTLLRLGSVGEDVRTIQRELNRVAANYPAIPKISNTNGIFDGATRNSVIKFQQIFNLGVDGIVGKQTWYKLKYIYNGVKNLAEIYSEGLTISEVERIFSRVLRQGDRGIGVKTIQYYLNFIGFFNSELSPRLTVDGIFGPATREAVIAFQNFYGLTPDGIVGKDTWNRMVDAYNGILNALPAEFRSYSSLLYPGYFITTGASGKVVEQLQTFLRVIAQNNNAVPTVTVDGIFGPQTQAAVTAVQRINGLPQNGAVGPITWNAIVNMYNEYR
ncbi:MAG: peptidoglycan-binding protein [Oscillospiraceae bacterium]|nr:peptidoglycan-binding protein [Oscillospiraceae bacterium]